MGCTKIGHCHQWPTTGTLIIQRCEIRCNFCDGKAGKKDWKYAWFLRRHVRAVHVKRGRYPDLQVDPGWDEGKPKNHNTGVTVKGGFPGFFVQQPLYDGQRYGQMPGGFGASSTVTDRTVDPTSLFGIDPYAMSVSAVAFHTEDPALLATHRANTLEDFEGFLSSMMIAADVEDDPSMMDTDSENDNIDPRLVQQNAGAGAHEDSAIDLTADEDNIMARPRKHKRSNSDVAKAKFFMDAHNASLEDSLDEMPLANVVGDQLYAEEPDFSEYWDLFSDNVGKAAEQMRAEGADIEAVQHMIPAVTLFAQALQDSK